MRSKISINSLNRDHFTMKHHVYQVYKWTCSKSKKSYIGYTGDGILFRWEKHLLAARSGTNLVFYRAIRKYGAAAWVCSVLYETSDKSLAEKAEKRLIVDQQTLVPNGYNCSLGGTGGNTWFGPNVERRKSALSLANSGVLNANSNGISDEVILDAAEQCWMQHRNWCQGEWLDICELGRLPKHIRPFRFAEFGGGLRGMKQALLARLKTKGIAVDEIKYHRTAAHNQNTANVLRGRVWVTETMTGRSYLARADELTKQNIIKGRSC
jgi:hypothetical protein